MYNRCNTGSNNWKALLRLHLNPFFFFNFSDFD